MCTWGVVTNMAPSTLCFLRFSSTAKCSSDVPGGVSTSSTSSSPHATSDTNWPIKAAGQEVQAQENMQFDLINFLMCDSKTIRQKNQNIMTTHTGGSNFDYMETIHHDLPIAHWKQLLTKHKRQWCS